MAETSGTAINVDRPTYQLDELLSGVQPGDLQAAVDWGGEVGREVVEFLPTA